jgi:hypothetical protein
MKDPYVEEVREARMEHTKQFNSDLELICEDLRQFESSLGDRVVTLEPRRLRATKRPKRRQ